MRGLLDTHAFLWFARGDAKLSPAAMAFILDRSTIKLVSPATYWEIAIKIALGKYTLDRPYEAFMQAALFDNGFSVLPIEPRHTERLTTLPHHHKDPFDRLLAATALVEGLTIISADPSFDVYGVARLW